MHLFRHLSLLLALAPVGTLGAQVTPAQERAIDSLFATVNADSLPGCVAGVMRNGRLEFARGYGQADLSSQRPLTPQTRIGIASLTKQFTAAAVALLVDQGRLNLDTDVREYIRELPSYDRPIRIRDLVFQTSGLRDYLSMVDLRGANPEDVLLPEEMRRLIARQWTTNHPPGTSYAYSNTNYFLLGEIVRVVTGLSLRDFAERELFRPLGMHNTTYALPGEYFLNGAESYRRDDGRLVEVHLGGTIGGDGGIWTTLEDLARWDAHFLRPALGRDPASFVRLIASPGTMDGGRQAEYGWGNQFGSYRGLATEGHGGTWGGFRVQYLRFPSEAVGLTILCNQLELSPFQLIRGLANIVLRDRFREPPPAAAALAPGAPPSAVPVTTDSAIAVTLVGEFWSPELDVRYSIEFDSRRLRLRIPSRSPIDIRVTHPDTLSAAGRTLVLQRNATAVVTGFVLSTGRVRGVRFERVDAPPPMLRIPRGTQVTIDGASGAGEWSDATDVWIPMSSEWVVNARVKHDGENLLIGFFNLKSGVARVPEVLIDARNDKGTSWKADDWWFHASARDCSSVGRYNDYSTCTLEATTWAATNVVGMTFPQVMELRIPMQLLGVGPGATVGLALNVTDTRHLWKFWPLNANTAVPGTWATAMIQR